MHKTLITILSAITLTSVVAVAEQATKPTGNSLPADRQVYGQYLLIQAALAGDSLKDVPEAAAAIAKLVRDDTTKKLPTTVAAAADKAGKASDIKNTRIAFKELSDALIAHRKTDKALTEQFYVIHCPMAFEDKGADWLQATKTVSNPYFGASMLRCGVIKE